MNGRKNRVQVAKKKKFEDTIQTGNSSSNGFECSKMELVALDIRAIYFEITSMVSNNGHLTSSSESVTVDPSSLFFTHKARLNRHLIS